jgi:acid phosphatase
MAMSRRNGAAPPPWLRPRDATGRAVAPFRWRGRRVTGLLAWFAATSAPAGSGVIATIAGNRLATLRGTVRGRWGILAWAASLGAAAALAPASAADLPRYKHIVVAVEENKDFDQIIGNPAAPYLNKLAAEGTVLTHMFAEEHDSQGNYFWLFSGNNQDVGFNDVVPAEKFSTSNLGAALIAKGFTFKGYAQSLPAIGSDVHATPWGCFDLCVYGRKHVPWISFKNVPDGRSLETSANLRFTDFPADLTRLPTVAFVIPDMQHDMHNGAPQDSIPAGDLWLRQNLDRYYQWAKAHDGLLIVTFDENADDSGYEGLTDPAVDPGRDRRRRDMQNRIPTIFAGAHVAPGHIEAEPLTHVNILRTIEAIYGLPKAGAQQPNALRAGIADETTASGAFVTAR